MHRCARQLSGRGLHRTGDSLEVDGTDTAPTASGSRPQESFDLVHPSRANALQKRRMQVASTARSFLRSSVLFPKVLTSIA